MASYPTSAKVFTTKNSGDTVQATHINDPQDEITAIEQDLIAGLPVARGGTGNTTLTANRVLLGNGTSAVAAAGAGTSGQVLTSNGASAPTFQDHSTARSIVDGRLTLTTAVPVTTADVTAAGTLYWALYRGNQIGLYTGSSWALMTVAELSIAVPAVANQVYDVFVDYNAGTPILALTAWTNDTTRATALTTQDGVLVKTGATGQRYVGTVRTVAASQLNDSAALRHVWNYYNRVARPMRVLDATNSWAPAADGVIQQANASALNQLDIVVGVAEDEIHVQVVHQGSNSAGAVFFWAGIGLDATNAKATGCLASELNPAANVRVQLTATLDTIPAIGRHIFTWLEESATAVSTTFFGDNNGLIVQSGISARWKA